MMGTWSTKRLTTEDLNNRAIPGTRKIHDAAAEFEIELTNLAVQFIFCGF